MALVKASWWRSSSSLPLRSEMSERKALKDQDSPSRTAMMLSSQGISVPSRFRARISTRRPRRGASPPARKWSRPRACFSRRPGGMISSASFRPRASPLVHPKISSARGFQAVTSPRSSMPITASSAESRTVRIRASLRRRSSCARRRSVMSTICPRSWNTFPAASRTTWAMSSSHTAWPSAATARYSHRWSSPRATASRRSETAASRSSGWISPGQKPGSSSQRRTGAPRTFSAEGLTKENWNVRGSASHTMLPIPSTSSWKRCSLARTWSRECEAAWSWRALSACRRCASSDAAYS